MFRLVGGLERPFDRSQNWGSNCWNFWRIFGAIWTVRDCVGAVWGICFIIYEINCVLVCMRPEMAMNLGFTKWNR